MKNFEKYIDDIANMIASQPCGPCPCRQECHDDDTIDQCEDFFKDWAMKEAKDEKETS